MLSYKYCSKIGQRSTEDGMNRPESVIVGNAKFSVSLANNITKCGNHNDGQIGTEKIEHERWDEAARRTIEIKRAKIRTYI